jgi:hypothetical protein
LALQHSEALDNIRVVQRRVDLYLAHQLPTRAIFHHRTFVHHLCRHHQVCRLVPEQVHLAEAALAHDVAELPVFIPELADELLLAVQVWLRSARGFFLLRERTDRQRGFFDDGAFGVRQIVDAFDLLGRQVLLFVRGPKRWTLGFAARVVSVVVCVEARKRVIQHHAGRLVVGFALRHRRVGFHDVQDRDLLRGLAVVFGFQCRRNVLGLPLGLPLQVLGDRCGGFLL